MKNITKLIIDNIDIDNNIISYEDDYIDYKINFKQEKQGIIIDEVFELDFELTGQISVDNFDFYECKIIVFKDKQIYLEGKITDDEIVKIINELV